MNQAPAASGVRSGASTSGDQFSPPHNRHAISSQAMPEDSSASSDASRAEKLMDTSFADYGIFAVGMIQAGRNTVNCRQFSSPRMSAAIPGGIGGLAPLVQPRAADKEEQVDSWQSPGIAALILGLATE
jgi:hypothetical protein